MTDDDATQLQQRIDDMIAAPLAVVERAIRDLEELRASLQSELAAHRAASSAPFVERRRVEASPGVEPLPTASSDTSYVERRRSMVDFVEPIAVNRPSFQS